MITEDSLNTTVSCSQMCNLGGFSGGIFYLKITLCNAHRKGIGIALNSSYNPTEYEEVTQRTTFPQGNIALNGELNG